MEITKPKINTDKKVLMVAGGTLLLIGSAIMYRNYKRTGNAFRFGSPTDVVVNGGDGKGTTNYGSKPANVKPIKKGTVSAGRGCDRIGTMTGAQLTKELADGQTYLDGKGFIYEQMRMVGRMKLRAKWACPTVQ